jgi:hypothetical protein
MQLLNLRAELQPATDAPAGTVTARLVPYGESIQHGGREVRFQRGSIRHDGSDVPVNLDHGPGALERIGLARQVVEDDAAMYVRLHISDTQAGRDALTLMRDGVLTDVSAGIWLDEGQDGPDFTGTLDHVAVVGKGAFGNAGAGSKVLAVHHKEEGHVPDENNAGTQPAPEPAIDLVAFNELAQEVVALQEQVAASGDVRPTEPRFASLAEALHAAVAGDITPEEFALAGDTTTGAAGLVPDWQSQEIVSIIDTRRPYLSTLTRDPIGSYGMTVNYPRVTQKPTVGVQATENTEVATQAFTVDTLAVDLDTYAGANLASRQVVERSQPSYVTAFFREMAGVYANTTKTAATADAGANAGGSAILADLGADAAATFAAISLASSTIAAGVRTPATDIVLATDRWTQLTGLVDADGRPLVVYGPNGPQNAQGQGNFGSMQAQYHGLAVWHDPDAAAGTCLIYSRDDFANYLEQTPVQLRAEVVSTLSWELGIYALFAHVVKYPAGGYTLTAA